MLEGVEGAAGISLPDVRDARADWACSRPDAIDTPALGMRLDECEDAERDSVSAASAMRLVV